MTKKLSALALFLILCNNHAFGQDRGFGLGIIIGEPTGISAKTWLGHSSALDFAVAWSFKGRNSLTLHADYLNHNFRLIKVDKGQLPFYYGIGGRIKFRDNDNLPGENGDTRLGVRIPVGLAYMFENVNLDLFVEIVPFLELVPETNFDLNAAIGVRYFFK